MAIPTTLGELVRRDRKLKNMTQDDLVKKLNGYINPPLDPFTRQPKVFHRSWLAKLENNSLQRDLSEEIRRLLAKTLLGDVSLYLSLETSRLPDGSADPDRDVLPLIKWIASQPDLTELTLDEFRRLCNADCACATSGISLTDPLGAIGKGAKKQP